MLTKKLKKFKLLLNVLKEDMMNIFSNNFKLVDLWGSCDVHRHSDEVNSYIVDNILVNIEKYNQINNVDTRVRELEYFITDIDGLDLILSFTTSGYVLVKLMIDINDQCTFIDNVKLWAETNKDKVREIIPADVFAYF